jgi:archaellin
MKIINYGLIIGIAFSLLIWSSLLFATTRNIGDSHEVKYTPLDTTGTLITSQTITLKIEKSSNSYTYNFVNSTFDNTSNNDTVNLAEGDDFYSYSWTPPLTETDSEEYNFIVSNANTTYKDKQTETVGYLDLASETKLSAVCSTADDIKARVNALNP